MLSICPELTELLIIPPSDTEPVDCYINKLRRMNADDREKEISTMNYIEQLKLARTHKVCLMLNQGSNCILKD